MNGSASIFQTLVPCCCGCLCVRPADRRRLRKAYRIARLARRRGEVLRRRS